MPSANLNLFTLQEQGDAGWAHGRAFATGNANASASVRRGIDLSAGMDIKGEIGGEVGEGVEASLSAGGNLTAGLSLRVAYPLDLFHEAGLVARLRAQAAAAAFLRAELSLDLDVFAGALRGRLPGPWLELAEIFLEEIKIGAGLWAAASVSVQLLAEAAIVGNILGASPGFTCSFQYAAGYGYGCGYSFKANYGLSNPRHLLDRLSDKLTAILEREISALLPNLNDTERTITQAALPLLPLVMPLALRMLYEQGQALTRPANQLQSATSNASVSSFVQEVQELLTTKLFDLAIDELNRFLASDQVVTVVADLVGDDAAQAVKALISVRDVIQLLSETDSANQHWEELVLRLLDAMAALTFIIPAADRDSWTRGLALAVSSAAIISRLKTWVSAGENSSVAFDPAAPLAFPSNTTLPAYIAMRLKLTPGTSLKLANAIDFIVLDQAEWLQKLNDRPEIKPIIDFLAKVFQGGSTGTLIQTVFQVFSTQNADVASRLFGTMVAALAPLVEQQVFPHLLDRLEASADADLKAMLHQIIRPTLLSLTRVILPRMASVDTADAALVMREQISAVLLQTLTRLVNVSSEILIDYAATEGPPILRNMAGELRAGAGGVYVDGALVVLSQTMSPLVGLGVLSLLFTPTREDLIDLIDIAADVIDYWNHNERTEWFSRMGTIITLGLATGDAALDTLWADIQSADPGKPLPGIGDALVAFAERLGTGTWNLVKFLADRLLALLGRHFQRLAETVINAVAAATRSAIEAVKTAADWLEKKGEELRALINQLANDIANLARDMFRMLQAFADHMLGLIDGAVNAVRDAGWWLVYSVLFNNDVFRLLPDGLEDSIVDGIRAMYNGAFEGLRWLLEAPLNMFRAVVIWMQEGITVLQSGGLSPARLLDYVRSKAQAMVAAALAFPIAFKVVLQTDTPFGPVNVNFGTIDLGSVILPGSDIIAALVGTLLGDWMLASTATNVVNKQNQITDKTHQINTMQVQLQNALTQEEAYAALSNISTEEDLTVTIIGIEDNKTYHSNMAFTVSITGANRTFVDNVLGIPTRVRILINGEEYHYAPGSWGEAATNQLQYRAKLVLNSPELIPFPLMPPERHIRLQIPDNNGFQVIKDASGLPVFRAISNPTMPPAQSPAQPIEVVPIGQPEHPPIITLPPGFPTPAHLQDARLAALDLPQPLPAPGVAVHPAQPGAVHFPDPSDPGRLHPVEPIPLTPAETRAIDLTNALGQVNIARGIDPFSGARLEKMDTSNPFEPVIVQPVQIHNVTADERARGFRLATITDLTLEFQDWSEPIMVRPGMNRIEIFVVDGAGTRQAYVGRTLFMAK